MNRTKNKTKPKPKPGGAKFNIAVDKELEQHAGAVSRALVREAEKGNPTCLHLLIRWAEDAEFAEECIKAHPNEIERWLDELYKEAQEAKKAEEAAKAQQAQQAKERAEQQSAQTNHTANATGCTPSVA